MEPDAVQVSVQISPERLEKAKRYKTGLSDATQYDIDQLARNQRSTVYQRILLGSMWLGFPIGCVPAVLLWLVLHLISGYRLLAVSLVQIIGMLAGFIVVGRGKFRRYYAEHPDVSPEI